MGFDVGVPGNHEFDEGVDELLRLQRGGGHEVTGYWPGSGFPLVLSNVVDSSTGQPILPPYVIKAVGGIPIGFIGVTTVETPEIVTPSAVSGLRFIEPATAVNRWVKVLLAKGVEAIMVLAHEGGSHDRRSGRIEGPIADIARSIDDAVDVIFSGHYHTWLNGVVDGKLIVQACSKGTAFADVDLVIDAITGDVVGAEGEIVTVWSDRIVPDKRIADLVASYEEQVRPHTRRKITETACELTCRQTEAGESALGNLIADAQRRTAGAQIAFVNPGGIRRDLPAGEITWGILYEVQPFGNDLMRFELSGEQIYKLLNQQWQLKGDVLRVRFLQVSGLQYSWDDSRPIGDKVVKVCLADGSEVELQARYSVVANSYISSGGDGFTVLAEVADKTAVTTDLEALVTYLKAQPQPVYARVEGRIVRVR